MPFSETYDRRMKNVRALNEFIEKANAWTRDMRGFLEAGARYDDAESALFMRAVQDAVNRFACAGIAGD